MARGVRRNYNAFMTRLLRAISLVAIATFTALLGFPGGAFADGRSDWKDYAWQQVSLSDCLPDGERLQCPPFHERWDWKRNQWVDITIALDRSRGTLELTQRLTNNDPYDDDHVCVTALVVDDTGKDLVAYHQNWHSHPGQVMDDAFRFHASSLDRAATIHIGSKQCRQGPAQDDALYAQVLEQI
jgi:hypothetical protein